MADSFVQYTGTGGTDTYNIPFGYLSKDHVQVKIDGVLKTVVTHYTYLSATQIKLVGGNLANGAILEIRRVTPRTEQFVNFTDGSTVQETDLDNNTLQILYLAQEANDAVQSALLEDSTGVFDAESKRIKNLAAPNDPNDAARKAYVDAIAVGAGQVPIPGNPADDNKFLRALAGAWSWVTFTKSMISDATAFALTWLGLADAAAGRTNLGVAAAPEPTTKGDILAATGANAWARKAAAANGKFLKTDSAQADGLLYDDVTQIKESGAQILTLGAIADGKPLRRSGTTVVGDRDNITRTEFVTTSGTAFDLTGILAAAKRITIAVDGVSLTGTDGILVQIGDAGGIENTGYSSTSGVFTTAGSIGGSTSTAGFILAHTGATQALCGHMVLTRGVGNSWVSSHAFQRESGTLGVGGGNKTLSAELDRVRITRTGADTFDAGSITVLVEY